MRRLSNIIVLFICFFSSSHAQTWRSFDNCPQGTTFTTEVLENNSSRYRIRITIHGMYDEQITHNQTNFHRLSFANDASLTNIGEPELPLITQLIAIPNETSCSVSVSDTTWVTIPTNVLYPAQIPLLENEEDTVFSISDSVYHSTAYFPVLASMGEEMTWRGIRNSVLRICPFKYYPTTNRLSVLKDLIVCVNFNTYTRYSPRNNIAKVPENDPWFLFCNNIGNHDKTRVIKTRYNDDYNYLILLGDSAEFYNSVKLKEFRLWKAFKGYKTKVVNISNVGTLQENIKDYIAQEYDKGVRYVLFIGDNDKIPLASINSPVRNNIHSDYWYGCLDGDSDYEAEIAVGRFSTNSVSELNNMINKSITYEQSYHSDNNVLLMAHKEYAPSKYQGCCEEIRIRSYLNPVEFTTAYGADSITCGGDNATNEKVINTINNGMHIVNYRGHGWQTYLPVWNFNNENFHMSEINNINDTIISVYFSIACWTGAIQYGPSPCMLETFTRSPHGAVAFLGASQTSYTSANHLLDKKLFTKLLNEDVFQLGNLNVASHISLVTNSRLCQDNALVYVCGGDPTLELWTSIPQSQHNIEVFPLNDSIYVSNNVNGDFTVNVVTESGDLLFSITTENGNCAFEKPDGNFYVSIDRHNFYPYIAYFNYDDNFIQNKSFEIDAFYKGTPLQIGYDVNPSESYGNVVVKSGSSLNVDVGSGGVVIKNGFECGKGATLEIK